MKKVFIRGNKERGSEVIKMLEDLGGVNRACLKGTDKDLLYYINKDNRIDGVSSICELSIIMQECFEELYLPKKKKLPNSWEEWAEQKPLDMNMMKGDFLEAKENVGAILALIKLKILRDTYRHGWIPNWKNNSETKYCIEYHEEILCTGAHTNVTRFLSFQSIEIRDKFYDNFKGLIEQAKEFI